MRRIESNRKRLVIGGLSAVGLCLVATLPLAAEPQPTRTDREALPKPVYRVAQEVADAAPARAAEPVADAAQGAHPLDAALVIANRSLATLNTEITDYTCTMMKRERIDDRMVEEIMFVKIKNEPLSVYMFYLSPSNKKGQEVIYVEGRNNGKLLAHGTGLQKIAGTLEFNPTDPMPMKDSRYPITDIGIKNLCSKLIDQATSDRKHGECQVDISKGAKINGRLCTRITVIHPTRRDHFKFNRAEVFVDDEMNIPVRYAAWDWPATAGGKSPLLEEYIYYGIKLNQNLTDYDFDTANKSYKF